VSIQGVALHEEDANCEEGCDGFNADIEPAYVGRGSYSINALGNCYNNYNYSHSLSDSGDWDVYELQYYSYVCHYEGETYAYSIRLRLYLRCNESTGEKMAAAFVLGFYDGNPWDSGYVLAYHANSSFYDCDGAVLTRILTCNMPFTCKHSASTATLSFE
jgi:hypothetical protein